MRVCIAFLWLVLNVFWAPGWAHAQEVESVDQVVSELTREIRESDRGRQAEVLLLGCFHFDNPGLDAYKPQFELDFSTEAVQQQVDEIVQLLVEFKPDRVAVERKSELAEQINQRYAAYRAGEFELPVNETYQIGFRVAAALGHERVYPIDAPGRPYEPYIDENQFARENGLRDLNRRPYSLLFRALAQRLDEMKTQHSLRQHLRILNHPEMLRVSHGTYLQRRVSVAKDGVYPGADGFVSTWYNRNLRIFGNLQGIIQEDKERIVAIFGAGHVPILRHFVESAPNLTLVEVEDVL